MSTLGQPICNDCIPHGREPNFTTSIPDKADKHCIPVFNTIMAWLAACGLSVDLNIIDNEASADFKRVITESWKTKLELVLPDMHWRNKAERMIRHFKNHSLSILASIDTAFPPYRWDLLLPQVKLTVNLLRQATINPKISAWESSMVCLTSIRLL
jgi:hypothetical protein